MKPTPSSFTLLLILTVCFGSLLIIADIFNSSVIAAPALQATATCAPQSTPTPVSSCPGGNPAPVLGRQPYPTTMGSVFRDAGLNRLGNNGPVLPQIWQGYGTQARQVAPYAPCILLEAMAYTESTGWKQFNTAHGECGFTKVGVDATPTPPPTPTPAGSGTCGYGVMQITSGMGGGTGFDPNLVVADYRYGVGTGAKILIDKWNGRYSLGYRVGENDPRIVEDWYYAVWAYNGFSWKNNPHNRLLYQPQNVRGIWLCGADPNQPRSRFPYQELIWGCAANPPGNEYWSATQLSLPGDSEVYTNDGLPPPLLLNRPSPSHTSCGMNYLPLVMKDWDGCVERTTYWYPTGVNTCSPSVTGCNQGDGQPDGVWTSPISVGYHQVEFTPQKVLASTKINVYWKTHQGSYGNLYIKAKLNNVWTQIRSSQYQSTGGRWEPPLPAEQINMAPYTGQTISGLQFGFTSSTGGHQFKVDGYRIINFRYCGE